MYPICNCSCGNPNGPGGLCEHRARLDKAPKKTFGMYEEGLQGTSSIMMAKRIISILADQKHSVSCWMKVFENYQSSSCSKDMEASRIFVSTDSEMARFDTDVCGTAFVYKPCKKIKVQQKDLISFSLKLNSSHPRNFCMSFNGNSLPTRENPYTLTYGTKDAVLFAKTKQCIETGVILISKFVIMSRYGCPTQAAFPVLPHFRGMKCDFSDRKSLHLKTHVEEINTICSQSSVQLALTQFQKPVYRSPADMSQDIKHCANFLLKPILCYALLKMIKKKFHGYSWDICHSNDKFISMNLLRGDPCGKILQEKYMASFSTNGPTLLQILSGTSGFSSERAVCPSDLMKRRTYNVKYTDFSQYLSQQELIQLPGSQCVDSVVDLDIISYLIGKLSGEYNIRSCVNQVLTKFGSCLVCDEQERIFGRLVDISTLFSSMYSDGSCGKILSLFRHPLYRQDNSSFECTTLGCVKWSPCITKKSKVYCERFSVLSREENGNVIGVCGLKQVNLSVAFCCEESQISAVVTKTILCLEKKVKNELNLPCGTVTEIVPNYPPNYHVLSACQTKKYSSCVPLHKKVSCKLGCGIKNALCALKSLFTCKKKLYCCNKEKHVPFDKRSFVTIGLKNQGYTVCHSSDPTCGETPISCHQEENCLKLPGGNHLHIHSNREDPTKSIVMIGDEMFSTAEPGFEDEPESEDEWSDENDEDVYDIGTQLIEAPMRRRRRRGRRHKNHRRHGYRPRHWGMGRRYPYAPPIYHPPPYYGHGHGYGHVEKPSFSLFSF